MKSSIAIVGCGGVSAMHLAGCGRHADEVYLAAACDPDPARLAQTQQDYGIPAGFSTLDQMIAGTSFDAAIVCTPTSLREAVVKQLAAAGKHILVEKPFASSLEEGRRMVAAADAGGVQLAVDQNFRCHFPFYIAKEKIADGLLGAVTAVHHQHFCFRQDSGWRILEKRHVLEIMGVHWLDGFRWMLGSDAQTVAALLRHSSAIDCAGETDLSVQVAFENGTAASYADSFSSLVPRCETVIIGERGTLRLEHGGAAFFDRSGGSQPAQTWENPYAGDGKPDSAFECLRQLLSAVESGQEPGNSGRDNLKTLALLEAAYRSSETGVIVPLSGGLL